MIELMKKNKGLKISLMTALMTLMSSVNAYATEVGTVEIKDKEDAHYDITKKASTIFDNIAGDLVIFSTSAIAVVIIICALMIMFSKNERAVQGAWMWGKRSVLAYIVIISVVGVVKFIQGFGFN